MSELLPYTERARLVNLQVNKFKNAGVPAEDLFQEGMLASLKAEQTFKPDKGAQFATYASKVIYNRLVDVIRKWQSLGEPPLDPTVEDPDKELWQIVKRVLATCKPLEQDIYKAHFSGLTYDEICARYGVNKKKIDNTIQKVRKLLKLELDYGN